MLKSPRIDNNESLISPVTKGRPRSGSGPIEFTPGSIASSSQSNYNPFMDISPEASFIAASAATGIVSSSQAAFFRSLQSDGEITMGTPTIPVTPGALRLINQFLDFLLFTILSNAKGTSLRHLRPAVQEALRARLATEAIAGADQELESYLGGEIGDELDELELPEEEWDLQGTWRRTRKRCMVYSSLGDLEEDDEDDYPEYENPNYDAVSATVARVVSPPVAIWLTAILEFIGEQCLHVAGHATVTRYSGSRKNGDSSGNVHMPSVEELDAERVALNPSLGRMWRQWRKRTRNAGSISLSGRESSSILSRLDRQASATSMRMSLYGGVSMESLRDPVSPKPMSVVDDMPATKEDEEAVPEVPTVQVEDTDKEAENLVKPATNSEEQTEDGPLKESRSSKKRPLSMSLMATFEEICRDSKRPRATSLPPPPKSEFSEQTEDAAEYCSCKTKETAKHDVLAKEPSEEEEKGMAMNRREFSFVNKSTQMHGSPVEEKDAEAKENVLAEYEEDQKNGNEAAEETGCCAACSKPKNLGTATAEPDEVVGEEAQVDETNEVSPTNKSRANRISNGQIGTAITTDDAVISVSSSACASDEDLSSKDEQKEPALTITIPQIAKPVEPLEEETTQSTAQIPRTFEADRLAANSKNGSLPSITEQKEDSESLTDFDTAESSPPSPAKLKPVLNQFLDSESDDEEPEIVVGKSVTVRAVSREVSRERDSEDGSGRSSPKSSTSATRLTPPLTVTVSPTSPNGKRRSLSAGKHSFEVKRAPNAPIAPIAAAPVPYGTGAPVRPWTPNTPTERSRRSSSFSNTKVQRPQTASSNNSGTPVKIKTFMTWPDNKPRKSEDGSSSQSSRDWSSNGRAMDDKEKNFEELIQSGGTIHCTITPDPIRDFDSDSIAEYSSVRGGRNGSIASYSIDMQRPSTMKSTSTGRTNATSIKIPASAARDARVTESSTQSLALFLRSTGPPDSGSIAMPKSATSEVSAHSINSLPKPRSNLSVSTPVDGVEKSPVVSPIMDRSRFVPREASGSSTGESTAYLADFFRTTNPPKVDGEDATQVRVSKTIAPFRNTMDSAQFEFPTKPQAINGANGRADINMSHSPGGLSSAAPESYQSSFNSTTGLVKNAQPPPRRDDPASMPAPQRKQTRIRDPYEIDYDDDYGDEEMDDINLVLPPAPSKKPQREEESLMDFLKNNPPPAPPTPRTPVSPSIPEGRSIQKKQSAISLMSRLGRTASRKSSITSPIDRAPPSLPDMPRHIPLISDNSSFASFKYGPMSEYSPTEYTQTPPRTPHSVRRPIVNAAPREAKVSRNDIDSLADFLKNTGPPPPPPRTEPPVLKTEKSFSRLRGMGMLRKKNRNVSGVA